MFVLSWGLLLFAALVLVAGFWYTLIRLNAALRGAAFYPTKQSSLSQIMGVLCVRSSDKAADLGSGDGRVLIALANAGAEAHGYEIDPVLVWWSRWRIRKAGVATRAAVHKKSFWGEDISPYDVVVVYGMPHIMARLEEKLMRELRPGARVVSNVFAFPEWKPSKVFGKRLYYYERP